jgi:hypothetical protein
MRVFSTIFHDRFYKVMDHDREGGNPPPPRLPPYRGGKSWWVGGGFSGRHDFHDFPRHELQVVEHAKEDKMVAAKDAVVWVNDDTKEVMVRTQSWGVPEDHGLAGRDGWCDPIGAAYSEWQDGTDEQRVRLMLETAIDLAMQGIPLKRVLKAFAEVGEFRALGRESYPMCRALTSALVGKCLEPNTMSFDALLRHHARP